METFEIRSYGKSELAMLYFPKAQTPGGALSNLNFWIRRKAYTPKEVALIVYYLGEP